MKQKTHIYRLLIILLFVIFNLPLAITHAQNSDQYGHISPVVFCIEENGQYKETPDTLDAGIEFTGSAPMKIVCESHVTAPEGVTWRTEWNLSRTPSFETNELVRYDDDTEFDFSDSGTYYIRQQITFTYPDDKSIEDGSETYIVRISESELKVPNAFSPNGDGINDIFKVYYKSLVKFNAYIFNRWGQQLYHWGLDDIDGGWDGTYHGKQVKDGVYFIVVDAEGSDGIKYKHKGDITILRGFSGNGSTTGGTTTEGK